MQRKPNEDGAPTPKKDRRLANLKPAWAPGQSGNPKGRSKGARNKLGEQFLDDMLAAWEEKGKAAIDQVIAERPHEFIKTVASILPKEVHMKTEAVEELSDDELAAALAALRSVTALASSREGSGTETAHQPAAHVCALRQAARISRRRQDAP